ncbi:MAG: hypothetical protein AAGF20_09110 [Pseudomonadota bacterium]
MGNAIIVPTSSNNDMANLLAIQQTFVLQPEVAAVDRHETFGNTSD